MLSGTPLLQETGRDGRPKTHAIPLLRAVGAPDILENVDAKDDAQMTADALNSLERRIGEDIADLKHDVADLKHDVADLKHDMHRLDIKIDVQHRATDEKLDRGFQQILEHLEKR